MNEAKTWSLRLLMTGYGNSIMSCNDISIDLVFSSLSIWLFMFLHSLHCIFLLDKPTALCLKRCEIKNIMTLPKQWNIVIHFCYVHDFYHGLIVEHSNINFLHVWLYITWICDKGGRLWHEVGGTLTYLFLNRTYSFSDG